MNVRKAFAKAIGKVFAYNKQIGVIVLSMRLVTKSKPEVKSSYEDGILHMHWIWRYGDIFTIIYKSSANNDESISVFWPPKQTHRRDSHMWWHTGYGSATLKTCLSGGGTIVDETRKLSLIESMFLMRLLRLCRKDAKSAEARKK